MKFWLVPNREEPHFAQGFNDRSMRPFRLLRKLLCRKRINCPVNGSIRNTQGLARKNPTPGFARLLAHRLTTHEIFWLLSAGFTCDVEKRQTDRSLKDEWHHTRFIDQRHSPRSVRITPEECHSRTPRPSTISRGWLQHNGSTHDEKPEAKATFIAGLCSWA